MRRALWLMALIVGCSAAWFAAAQDISWQEAVARLTYERSQVKTCVAMLKKYGSKPAKDRGAVAYDEAKAEYDAVIAGLIVALAGGRARQPAGPGGAAAARVREADSFCNGAGGDAATTTGQKGAVAEIVSGVVGPLVDAVKAIWLRKMDATPRRTRQSSRSWRMLWPSFESVSPSP